MKIRGGLVIRPRIEVVECDPEQISFHYYSWHLGDYERKLQARGLVQFLPMILRSLPCLYRDRPSAATRHLSPSLCRMTRATAAWASPTTPGVPSSSPPARWSLRSTSACPGCKGWTAATASISRRRIISWRVSMNPCPCAPTGTPAPLISGSPSWWPRRFRTERSSPWGVGSVPFAVASMLADSDIKDLGCHTGTISDAFLRLFQKGKLTNSRKEVDRGYATWNLAMGSQELYDWLDREPDCSAPAMWTMSTPRNASGR